MGAPKIAVVHATEPTAAPVSGARRTDQDLRREVDRARQVYGEMLRTARGESSGRAVAAALGVDEATLRRWEAGEVAAPLDMLERLPPSIAQRLAELLDARVRVRALPPAQSPADYLQTLTACYAAVLTARGDGGSPIGPLLDLAREARDAAGRRFR